MVQLCRAAQAVEGVPMVMTVTSARRRQSDLCNFIIVSCGLRRCKSDTAHGTQPDIGVFGLRHIYREPALTLLELGKRWVTPAWDILQIELAVSSQRRVVGLAVGGDGHMTPCWDQHRPVRIDNERARERLHA